MFDAAGTSIIVTSDHGHCEIGDDADAAVIPLTDVVHGFTQASVGAPWRDSAPMCLELLGIDVDTLCWQDVPRRRDPSC
jgi:hypothetical protein